MIENLSQGTIKILRVVTRLNVGGPAQHVAYLSAGLNSRGFTTTLVSGRIDPGEGDMGYFCEKLGVRVSYIDELVRPITPLKDLKAFFKILRIIWKEKPDILHTHLAKAGFLARTAALVLKPFGVRPVILHTYHGHVFHSYFTDRRNRLHLFLERLTAKWTDRIVVVSSRLRQELIHAYDIAPSSNFRVVPLGFDLSPFLERPRRQGAFRKRIQVEGKTVLIGIVGRLTAVKDHTLFLDSFMEVLKQNPGAVAVIVGDGEERGRIRTHAERLGISGHVRWAGFSRDLPEIYSDLDVLALTSKNEGTPVAVIEAQAAGCPVVAADVGGTSDAMPQSRGGEAEAPPGPDEQILERAGGFLVRRRTAENFAKACMKILDGSFKADPNTREMISESFNVERLCEDTAHLYKNTITAVRPVA